MRSSHVPTHGTVFFHHSLFRGARSFPRSLFFFGWAGEEFLGLLEEGGVLFGVFGVGLGGELGVFDGIGCGGVGVCGCGGRLAWGGHCEVVLILLVLSCEEYCRWFGIGRLIDV